HRLLLGRRRRPRPAHRQAGRVRRHRQALHLAPREGDRGLHHREVRMTDARSHFHQELEDLEKTLLRVADQAEQMVRMAVDSFVQGDLETADEVIRLDDGIDATYLDVHNRWMTLMARQQPMGSDLRMMSVLL